MLKKENSKFITRVAALLTILFFLYECQAFNKVKVFTLNQLYQRVSMTAEPKHFNLSVYSIAIMDAITARFFPFSA